MAGKKKLFRVRKAKKTTAQIDCLEGLPAPNHAHSPGLYDMDEDLLSNTDSEGKVSFPLMKLAKPESDGAGHASTLAFLDERYGVKKWSEMTVCIQTCKDCTKKAVIEF